MKRYSREQDFQLVLAKIKNLTWSLDQLSILKEVTINQIQSYLDENKKLREGN